MSLKEEEIRPKDLFTEYLNLSAKDAEDIQNRGMEKISCPACGVLESEMRFCKNSFSFESCLICQTLYCNPRPSQSALQWLYEISPSSQYWNNVFYPAVANIRSAKIFSKQAKMLKVKLDAFSFYPQTICDIGAGYGLFLENLKLQFPEAELYAVEPSPKAAEACRAKGITAIESTVEETKEFKKKFDLIISSQLIEHIFSPLVFLRAIKKFISSEGYFFLIGLGYEGYDVLTLQEHSQSIFPPHHLNFISLKGFEILFKKAGFSEVEIESPGELDVDIVRNSEQKNEFVRVLASRGEEAIQEFQTFLRKWKLSSHVWVMAKNS